MKFHSRFSVKYLRITNTDKNEMKIFESRELTTIDFTAIFSFTFGNFPEFQMPNSALENAVSINSHVSEPILWSEYRISRGEYASLVECPDAELGTRCRDVCLDEFIACINDCGSETEERFQNDAIPPTLSLIANYLESATE